MKKVLILMLMSVSVIVYSKSILDHDFGFQDCDKWTQEQIDDMKRKYSKNKKDWTIMKNYDHHKNFKNKWDKMCGWWTDGTVVVNIEYKDGYYCYMLYKNKHYLKMNLDKVLESDTTLRKDIVNRYKRKEPNITIDEVKSKVAESSKKAREEHNILVSNDPIYTYNDFYPLMSDEEGNLWRASDVMFWKTPSEMLDKGHILYANAFTLTEDGKLFLKAEDKEYISYKEFEEMFGRRGSYLYYDDYTMYESKRVYIDYQFLAKPLRQMTQKEIKNFKNKNIHHEKLVRSHKYSEIPYEWNPYYFDGATKTRVI